MSSRFSPSDSRSRSSAPGEHGAGRVDAHRPGRLAGQRTELVQAEVHLVGDVAEVAPASGGAAVVHLERRRRCRARRPGSPSCPGRRCRARCACPGTSRARRGRGTGSRSGSAPSGNGSRCAAVAGADRRGLLHVAVEDPRSRRARVARDPRVSGSALEGPVERLHQRAARSNSRAVGSRPRGSPCRTGRPAGRSARRLPRDLLGEREVAAAGEVAEEVALALARPARTAPAPRLRMRSRTSSSAPRRLRRRRRSAAPELIRAHTSLELGELRAVLLGAEDALELAEEASSSPPSRPPIAEARRGSGGSAR